MTFLLFLNPLPIVDGGNYFSVYNLYVFGGTAQGKVIYQTMQVLCQPLCLLYFREILSSALAAVSQFSFHFLVRKEVGFIVVWVLKKINLTLLVVWGMFHKYHSNCK